MAEQRLDSGPINTIVFHPDGQRLFTAGYDGAIREWTTELQLRRTTQAHGGPVKSLAWSRVADVLVAGSSDDTVSVWRDGERLAHIEQDDLVLVNGVACSPVAPHLATASRDGTVRIWHCLTGELVDSLPACHIKSVKAIAYSPDGQTLLTSAYDGLGVLWSRQTDASWRARKLALHGKPGVPAVAWAGQSALTAGWDGRVGRWSLKGELIAALPKLLPDKAPSGDNFVDRFQARDVLVRPKPVRAPRPILVNAGSSPAGMDYAARHCGSRRRVRRHRQGLVSCNCRTSMGMIDSRR